MMLSRWKVSRSSRGKAALTLSALMAFLAMTASAVALPPSPPNDTIATAEVIGPDVPLLVYGTTVLATDDVSTTGLAGLADDVDGPDVFYSFTPTASDTYRIHLLPWQHAPLRASDRRFIIYIMDDTQAIFAGQIAPGTVRPVSFDVALEAGNTYTIGVDHNASTAGHDNFPFTLMVATLPATNPDNCATAIDLPAALPVVVLNDIDAATPDFTFTQGEGRCAVSGTTPTTAAGDDHVYHFVPDADGDYAIELASSGFNDVLYIMDDCPGVFPFSCFGASDHSTGGTAGGKHEFVVVTLEALKDYYIIVDSAAVGSAGSYALIIDQAAVYEINEIEPNESASEATPVSTPFNGGQLVGPADQDWWGVTGATGDRVYAWVNNGGSSNSTLDTFLGFYAADGSTLIEFDDDDGDGADAPIEDLYFIYSTSSSVIAGAKMTSNGTHFWHVTDNDSNDTRTVHRYRFHVGHIPGTWSPLGECEPNDTIASADRTGKNFFRGLIEVVSDVDFYAFDAEVGDRVFIAIDGDPERDATGVDPASADPRAFHAKAVIFDPAGDILISDISDSNSIEDPPDFPAQGGFFVARTAGTHYVSVQAQGTSSQVGPEETYELAIFVNDAAPALTEAVDPILTLTPDHDANVIAVTATDMAAGDTGICSAELIDDTNLVLTNITFTPGDGTVNFTVALIDGGDSGYGKLLVRDCAGNVACAIVKIDVNAPTCDGTNFSNRSPVSMHGPIIIPDNEPSGPGIDGTIDIVNSGAIFDVNVTLTIETISAQDIDAFLISPSGTSVELITDRGSSLAFDITDATFDDSATEIMPILSSAAPYTGTWLPEDPQGLAKLIGEDAQGTWRLNVRDDSSSASGGSRLVEWSLDIDAGFAGPESFAGRIADTNGFDCGIASIVLTDAVNVELTLPPDFTPGDLVVEYLVSLIDTSTNGSGTVVVTDLGENTCQSVISLAGLPDVTPPDNTGSATRNLTFGAEVQAVVPTSNPAGVVSTINVPDEILVGEVEVDLTIDTENIGRLASTLSHGGAFASLINRVGMDERGSVGLTKDNINITLDDDAPVEDDAHLEPALGTIMFLGLHQPDGRGEFIGDGIDTDDRDNMLFRLAGKDSGGDWNLFVGDFRIQGDNESVFRRWSMTIKSPCGAERYVGTAKDVAPGTGICSIELAAGADNLEVLADFAAGDEVVSYRVELIDSSLPGSGTLEITDCNGGTTTVPIDLAAASGDTSLPMVTGNVDLEAGQFIGTATETAEGNTGIEVVELAPFAENLELVSVIDGEGVTEFVVGLIDSESNGRGYVRAIDGCGLRGYALIEIDVSAPVCTGDVGTKVRYFSGDLSLAIPDNNPAGVTTSLVVADTEIVSDADLTFNITHGFDDDIDMTLVSPATIALFSDIGSTANDFIDTTLDDEASQQIPDSESEGPFTGSYQPEGGPALSALDGVPASGTYTLRVVDDAAFNIGTFDSWSLLVESAAFPQSFDGRAEDGGVHDSGICSVELEDGAVNLTLTVDPAFETGDAIVRYLVELDNPALHGGGTVTVTDCAGNTCTTPICLRASFPPAAKGDLDGDGDIDLDDYALFAECLDGPVDGMFPCGDVCELADFDDDGDVDLRDFAGFQVDFD